MIAVDRDAQNAAFITAELEWFISVLDLRMDIHAGAHPPVDPLIVRPAPAADNAKGSYAQLITELELAPSERLLIMLALVPQLRPAALDSLMIHNQALGRRFTEFGGIEVNGQLGLQPTAETALFLLAGSDIAARLRCEGLVEHTHRLYRRRLLQLDHPPGEGFTPSARLRVTPETRAQLLTGADYEPPFSAEFPARRIQTSLSWDDLVLEPRVRTKLDDIVAWARHGPTIMADWGLGRRLTPGFRALFCGPPGTGKTLTACLLGQATGYPVYRVDLSQVISKYIGETEKNLAGLFDRAEDQNWILFFDEADALFGQRGEAETANDRAANQQVAYLLQRFEQFTGIALLASNLRNNIDDAFTRRFQLTIDFAAPKPPARRQLWANNFEGQHFALGSDVDLDELANEYEITGGSIVNVLRLVCLRAIERDPPTINRVDLVRAIQRELDKEGKVLRGRSLR